MASQQSDESLTPQYGKTIEFLQLWCPEGRWVTTAIDPKKKRPLETQTFEAADHAKCEEWLTKQGDLGMNLYFQVNPLRVVISGKGLRPSREHVEKLVALHVDVDPPTPPKELLAPDRAADLDAFYAGERERILGMLREPPSGIPPPTCINFSGGGFQAFWHLEVPRTLDGTEADYEDAALYNKRLEQVFRADPCHEVAHLMRLPGAINRPNEKKIKEKGRTARRAELIEWHPERVYGIGEFEKATDDAAPSPSATGHVVKLSTDVQRFSSVDEIEQLKGKEYAQCRVVIVQGLDPDNPGKHPSKSEWQHFVCCEMVRAGCDDDTIYSVITDPEFGVSKTVLEKGRGAERYAVRQIERAREEAIDPLLRELNDKHALIGSIGGKCRITTWEKRPLGKKTLGREVLQLQNQADFLLRYRNRTVDWLAGDGKVASKPAAIWWLEHRQRREFDGIVFDPSVDGDVDGHLNLWRGFSVSAVQGKYPLFRELVDRVLAAGDPVLSDYLWRWTAWLVQNPARQAEVAIVLRGLPGTGKGTFVRALGRLFGQHFAHVSSSQHVSGKFNAHMRDCVLMFADEAFLGDGGQDAIGTMKRIITEETLFIEGKGQDAIPWPNRLHIVLASNEDWVVPAGPQERRYVVTDVSAEHKEDFDWFAAIDAEMDGGGLSALLHDMLAMDLGDWHPRRDRPQTAALTDQKVRSLSGIEAAWFECLQSGELPVGKSEGESVWIASSEFLDRLNMTCRPKVPFNANHLKALLAEPQKNHRGKGMGFETRREKPGEGVRGYVVPPLAEARRLWNERRFPYTWDDAQAWVVRGFDAGAYNAFT